MPLQAINLLYSTPDLPGPVAIPMWVTTWEGDDRHALQRRALFIGELTVQATLDLYGVRTNWDDEEDD